ncbi:MAG: BrnT family toxin [Oscillospiraceae bacterium]|nr:BrnT family toxin [Oscillospiraceae bacterium]
MKFEWNEIKNNSNIEKHDVSFEEAMTVFKDKKAVLVYDKQHSDEEDRFNIIGISQMSKLLIVCHCYRENDTIIRIISARKPTKTEVKCYERGY